MKKLFYLFCISVFLLLGKVASADLIFTPEGMDEPMPPLRPNRLTPESSAIPDLYFILGSFVLGVVISSIFLLVRIKYKKKKEPTDLKNL